MLQYPSFFAFFHSFTASSSILSNNIYFLQDSQASFGTKLKNKCFSIPCTGHCPCGITMLEGPLAAWGSAAMLLIFCILYAVATVKKHFLLSICIFATVLFAHFRVKNKQALYEEGPLNFL